MTTHTNAEVSAALRKLADLVEMTDGIPVAYTRFSLWHSMDKAVLAELTRAALRVGATVTKDATGGTYVLSFGIGPLQVEVLAPRATVCERVIVGTREVTEMVPDPSLPTPPMVEQTRTEDVVEWRCQPLMALDQESGVA